MIFALRRGDLGPGLRRDVLRLQQRDAAVLQAQVVAVRAVRAGLDVLDRLLERVGEVPEHRGQEDMVLVDRGHVADVADEPDLVARLRRLDRLEVAERGVVAHGEDHVRALRDHAVGDALAARGVVVAGRADRCEVDLRRLVDRAEARREPAAHLVPVGIGGRDDDPDLVRLGRPRGQDARQVGALLARRGDVRDEPLGQVRRDVVGHHGHLVLPGDAGGDGVVAARVGDDEARSALRELPQDDVGLVVADVGDGLELRADGGGGGLGAPVALLVPAVVALLRGRREGDLRHLRSAERSGRVGGAGPDECDDRYGGDDSRSR